MPDTVSLRNFEVEGFRAIRRLAIPEFGRVNLFVGKNNAGKTSLLEAIRLYLHRNTRSITAVIYETVRAHSEFRPVSFGRGRGELEPGDVQSAVDAVESLFHGSFDEASLHPIRMTQEAIVPEELSIWLPWDGVSARDGELAEGTDRPVLIDPYIEVLELRSESTTTEVPLEWFMRRLPVSRPALRNPAIMLGASGLSPHQTRQMWDRVAVAGQEILVEEALRIIVPDLERILLVGESGNRSVLLKLKGSTRPVPMQGMGDGVNRVFGIAVALILSRGGALLVDEVENGVHYSIQEEMWSAIFSLASKFDVQVFATSHSWDAVLGFQLAANQSAADGMLYRLERADGGVYAERYTEQEVAVAAAQSVEVR
jgi:energy-coupling factor transporter ATP-binding protein EcfA2